MDPLTSLALVGTTRQGEGAAASGSPVDSILEAFPDLPPERRVLLAAGVRAAAAMAGRRSSRSEETVPEAPAESRPACSAKAARLIGDLLAGHHGELLPEAFTLLARSGRRLPHPLLPEALRVRGDLRALVRPVLGERGPWLARLNEPWSWATGATAPASLEELERAWADGGAAARRELLVRARGLDAARALGWLQATWSSEKAEERATLLAGLVDGLSAADEPFLEAALGDRAAAVREAAQSILAQLPGSGFVRRMTARADAMLDFKRSALSFAGKRGTLVANPPEQVDAGAARDGLGKPPQGTGVRAFWLTRALAAVPVAHWSSRFDATPAQLVAAAEATDWGSALCEGWARAALVDGAPEWLGALWDFFQRSHEKSVTPLTASTMALSLLKRMTPTDSAGRVEPLLGGSPSRIAVASALAALPSPWPASLGKRWIEAVHREARASPLPGPLHSTLRTAALALPSACFARALEPLELGAASLPAWERPLAELAEVLRLRNDLAQEIHP